MKKKVCDVLNCAVYLARKTRLMQTALEMSSANTEETTEVSSEDDGPGNIELILWIMGYQWLLIECNDLSGFGLVTCITAWGN